MEVWAQATMDTKDSPVHHGSKGQVIEYFTTPSPNIAAPIFPLTFVVKAIDLCDLSGFVVASYEGDALGVAYFKGKEKEESLDAVESTIHKVAYLAMRNGAGMTRRTYP